MRLNERQDPAPYRLHAAPAAAAVVVAPAAPAPAEDAGPSLKALDYKKALALHCPPGTRANPELVQALRMLARFKGADVDDDNDRHTVTQGIVRAAAVLSGAPERITSLQQLDCLGLPYIGDGEVRDWVREFMHSNSIQRLEELRANAELVARERFLRIPGVGPGAARRWTKEGHRTLADLQRALAEGTLSTGAGLDPFAAASIPAGEAVLSAFAPGEINELFELVESTVRGIDDGKGILHCERTGGHVRRAGAAGADAADAEESAIADSSEHDLDVLVRYPDADPRFQLGADTMLCVFVERLQKRLLVLAQKIAGVDGDGIQAMRSDWAHISVKTPVGAANMDAYRKAFLIVQVGSNPPRRLDVVFVATSQWAFARLGWTGSRQFERFLRLWAMEKMTPELPFPLRLTNHCLIVDKRSIGSNAFLMARGGKLVPLNDDAAMKAYVAGEYFETEKEIFDALGIECREPRFRCL